MKRDDQNHYTAPDITAQTGIWPESVICASVTYGFSSSGGVINGEANSADNGYGSFSNGEY